MRKTLYQGVLHSKGWYALKGFAACLHFRCHLVYYQVSAAARTRRRRGLAVSVISIASAESNAGSSGDEGNDSLPALGGVSWQAARPATVASFALQRERTTPRPATSVSARVGFCSPNNARVLPAARYATLGSDWTLGGLLGTPRAESSGAGTPRAALSRPSTSASSSGYLSPLARSRRPSQPRQDER